MIPENLKKVKVDGATVDFFVDLKDGIKRYFFNTSQCMPPDPMINALAGLKLIFNTDNELIMINHSCPSGLFEKIEGKYLYEVDEVEERKFKITFKYKK